MHGHGSILQLRTSFNSDIHCPAMMLRDRTCVPSPQVTVHDVQSVQFDRIHPTVVDATGVIVVDVEPSVVDVVVIG